MRDEQEDIIGERASIRSYIDAVVGGFAQSLYRQVGKEALEIRILVAVCTIAIILADHFWH